MTIRFLLDTNVVSEPFRLSPDETLLARLREHDGEAAICAPIWHELRFGCARLPSSGRRRALEQYLAEVVQVAYPILPYDEAAAAWHAEERARLEDAGRTMPFVDGQIAGVAAVRGLTLVTRNTDDFADLDGVGVKSWFGVGA